MFSIELKSREHLKNVALPNDEKGNVLIEGVLGKLENLSLTEGIMLEIDGTNGSLRMDLTEQELKGLLRRGAPLRKKASKKTNLTDTKAHQRKVEVKK